MTTPDPIRQSLLAQLGRKPTPELRQRLASYLESLAAEQRALAEAEQRVGPMLRREQLRAAQPPRPKGGRPMGSGARFVKIDVYQHRSTKIHIGRAIWQDMNQFRYVAIGYKDGRLTLTPSLMDFGFSVTRPPNGMPAFSIGRKKTELLHLENGHYATIVENGDIIITHRIED